ncbi:MAG: hypothetical protein ACJ78Q_04540 [Chloroflexia bacterium]
MAFDSGAILLFGVPAFGLVTIVAGLVLRNRALYWIGVGTLVGLGLITFSSVGVPLLLIGVGLTWWGFRRFGSGAEEAQAWIALVTIGITPVFVIVFGYYTTDRQVTSYSDDYLALTLPFLAVTLLGVLLGLVEMLRKARTR